MMAVDISSQALRSSGWLLILGFVLLSSSSVWSETIAIDLGQSRKDPLIGFMPSKPSASLQSTISKDGILIRQVQAKKGADQSVTGFKSFLSASGDVRVSLNIKWINQSKKQKDQTSMRLTMMVTFDDPNQTVLQYNLKPLEKAPGSVGISRRKNKTNENTKSAAIKSHVTEARLIIARVGDEAIFTMQGINSAPIEIARFPCTTADLDVIEVWCSRNDTGNCNERLLLKRLEVDSSSFFAFQTSRYPTISWWAIFMGANVVLLIGLFYAMYRRQAS